MGVLVLLICILSGYCVIRIFTRIKNPVVIFAGSFICGCLISGTFLYITDLLFISILGSYSLGNIIFLAVSVSLCLHALIQLKLAERLKKDISALAKDKAALVMLVLFLAFSFWLNYHTFSTDGDALTVAGGAWSDIIYHHAYVRTVSIGNNVPVQYPYYAGEPMHYHFMYNYFVGKLAQNGLNSAHALNIMSSIGLAALLMLIFEFGRVYFKSSAVGVMGALFLLFHSSLSVFTWIGKNIGEGFIDKVLNKQGWLEGAMFENWGLFNLNVFINRRNFAFALAAIVFIVMLVLDRRSNADADDKRRFLHGDNIILSAIIGILPFWNVVAAVTALAFIGAFAIISPGNRKFFYGMLCTGVIAFILILPQVLLFKSGESLLSEYPRFHIGYGTEGGSVFGIPVYYFRVLGIKFLLIIFSFFVVNKQKKFDYLVFLIPFAAANTLQFGKVLYDNNQFLFIWLIFANCFAACALVWLWRKLHLRLSFIVVALALSVMLAGVLDLFSVINMGKATLADDSSRLKNWIVENTAPDAVFLTDHFIHYGDNSMVSINLAGRKLYCVRNCVDGSCDVWKKYETMKMIYSSAGEIERVKPLLEKEGIDYIVIDSLVRSNADYNLNEAFFNNNFTLVYNAEGISVYSVGLK